MSKKAGREFRAFVPEDLVKRVRQEIVREKFVTPYMLAERYSITISLARRVLKRLREEGVLELYEPSRRASIYVVKASK